MVKVYMIDWGREIARAFQEENSTDKGIISLL